MARRDVFSRTLDQTSLGKGQDLWLLNRSRSPASGPNHAIIKFHLELQSYIHSFYNYQYQDPWCYLPPHSDTPHDLRVDLLAPEIQSSRHRWFGWARSLAIPNPKPMALMAKRSITTPFVSTDNFALVPLREPHLSGRRPATHMAPSARVGTKTSGENLPQDTVKRWSLLSTTKNYGLCLWTSKNHVYLLEDTIPIILFCVRQRIRQQG